MRRLVLSIVLSGGVGLFGCGKGSSGEAAPSGSAQATGSARPTGAPATTMLYPELAQPPVDKGTGRTEALRGTRVIVGVPAGWRTADVPAGAAPDSGDAMGGCLFITHPARDNTTVCAVRMDTLPTVKGKDVGAKTLERYALIARFEGAEWGEWTPGIVGAKRLPAKIAHARSGAREGIAAWVVVPGRQPVLVVGSWGDDAEKAAVFEILRGVDIAA